MLQSETQGNFRGFGNGNLPGEVFHASNMALTQFGLSPFYKDTEQSSSSVITGMQLIRAFVDLDGVPFGFSDQGKVVSLSGSWAQTAQLSVASSGNGMIVDQTDRLLVMNDRYLSKYNGAGSFTETWKDLTSSVTGDKVMDTYLDWVVIPHGNNVGLLNVTDDSFTAVGLNFPSGCKCIIARANRTGILLGVNMGSRSFVALWDAQSDRSIAPWIWSDYPILSICRVGDGEWIVTTTQEIFSTNGYTKATLPSIPEILIGQSIYNTIGTGTLCIDRNFYMMHTVTSSTPYGRVQSGLYILNLDTKLWLFVPASGGATQNLTMGAIGSDSRSRIWTSHRDISAGKYIIGQLSNTVPATASLITNPFGRSNDKKIASGVKVEFLPNNDLQTSLPLAFTISVKTYDFTRPLWGVAVENGTAPALNKVTVDGTMNNKAQQGDEVTFLSGLNAGQVRHITSIANQGLVNETWTLDSALSNLTADTDLMNVLPFKLAQKFPVSATSLPVDGMYFNTGTSPKGKKFLVKVLLEGISNVTSLNIVSVSLLYNDLITV